MCYNMQFIHTFTEGPNEQQAHPWLCVVSGISRTWPPHALRIIPLYLLTRLRKTLYIYIYISVNQQSEYKVFYKLMCWLGVWLVDFAWWSPLQRGDLGFKFSHNWLMFGSSRMRFLYHTQRPTAVGRTPLDEWSACRRGLYLTTHNTHDRHPCPRWDSNPRSQQASGRILTP